MLFITQKHRFGRQYSALRSIHVLCRHFGLGDHENTLSTTFVLSFYDLHNEVSHDRVTFKFLNFPLKETPTMSTIITLGYPNDMCRIAFDNSESLKSNADGESGEGCSLLSLRRRPLF